MKPSHTPMLVVTLPIILALIGASVAILAWYPAAHPNDYFGWSDLIYRGFTAIGISDQYAIAGHNKNRLLDIARWVGVIVTFWAILIFVYTYFRSLIWYLQARSWRNHVVIFGQNPFSDRIAIKLKHHKIKCVQMCPDESEILKSGSLIKMPLSQSENAGITDSGELRARQILISLDNDTLSIGTAISVRKALRNSSVLCRLTDFWLAHNIQNLPGAETVRTFTDADIAAREILRRQPPFLIAKDLQQSRIHLVLIGDHDWLEALFVEASLSAYTITFGKLNFSFITENVSNFEQRLRSNYPELEAIADVFFYELNLKVPNEIQVLNQIKAKSPITSIYCAFVNNETNLSFAVILKNQFIASTDYKGPLFFRVTEGKILEEFNKSEHLPQNAFVGFGSHENIALATGVLNLNDRSAEQIWHEAYLKFASKDKTAAVSWPNLTEEFRKSNQRAVGHIYAKLFDVGFNLRDWLKSHNSWTHLPTLAKGEILWRDEAERTRLAELEHDRWMLDRRLSGWKHGEMRDNVSKTHDNLLAFGELSEEVKSYDYLFIDLLNKILKRSQDGMKRTLR